MRDYDKDDIEERYDEEGYLIPPTPLSPINIPIVKSNLKLLK